MLVTQMKASPRRNANTSARGRPVRSRPPRRAALAAARAPCGRARASSRARPPAPQRRGVRTPAAAATRHRPAPKPSDSPVGSHGIGTRQPSRPFTCGPSRARSGPAGRRAAGPTPRGGPVRRPGTRRPSPATRRSPSPPPAPGACHVPRRADPGRRRAARGPTRCRSGRPYRVGVTHDVVVRQHPRGVGADRLRRSRRSRR